MSKVHHWLYSLNEQHQLQNQAAVSFLILSSSTEATWSNCSHSLSALLPGEDGRSLTSRKPLRKRTWGAQSYNFPEEGNLGG
ncbi:hypothetical protein AVEN_87769-1 [Araneus ventricosus]|uniref:Uncharacterized protein n=1 Tax=Araneus ventricosus TaxID=182803 RepID=A0A4Y2VIX1_ARAVE|nr:hypothetical protein AVEN_87769-1 [Araneus ventricosus]